MFVPTSQFHLYDHVTSRGHRGDSGDGDGSVDDDDDDDDDDDVDDVCDEDDVPQLTVICRAARHVRFYLLNVFLVWVFIDILLNGQLAAMQCVDYLLISVFLLEIAKAQQRTLEWILVSKII